MPERLLYPGIYLTLHCDVVYIEEILRSVYPSTNDVDSEDFFPHIQKKVDERSTNLIVIDNFPNNLEQYTIWRRHYPTPILTLHILTQNSWQPKSQHRRLDDSQVDTISRFLKYQNHTIPVIDYLKAYSHVVEINRDQTQ